jgi:membrane-associated phospholipid phosphatase
MSFSGNLATFLSFACIVAPGIASAQTTAARSGPGVATATTPLGAPLTAAGSAHSVPWSPSGPRRPYRLTPEIDIPLWLFGATAWPIADLALHGEIPPGECPCDSGSLNSLDRLAVGLNTATSSITFATTYAIFGFVAAGDALDVGLSKRSWYEFFEDVVVITEAISLAATANGLLQVAITRPRPSVYDVLPGAATSNPDSYASFPSATATYAFVAAAAGAMTYTLRHPKSPWRFVYWGGGMAVSATAGVLRVLAGRHFPTDVLMSAALGSLIGVVVPWLHARHVPATVGGAVFDGGALATVTMAAP